MSMPQPGDAAPAFSLASDSGPISLADFAGKKLVVYFYPKDDTPGCTTEGKAFSALQAGFAAADTQVLGISRDSVASHAKFRKKHELTVALGSDEGGKIHVWQEIHGDRTRHLPDRPRWQNCPRVAESESARPRRSGAGCGAVPGLTIPAGTAANRSPAPRFESRPCPCISRASRRAARPDVAWRTPFAGLVRAGFTFRQHACHNSSSAANGWPLGGICPVVRLGSDWFNTDARRV
jgi:peroxiredoxin